MMFSADLARIDVHVDELASTLVHLEVTGVAVIEAGPHSQNQRGIQKDLVYRTGCCTECHVAGHERVVPWDAALSHVAGDHGNLQSLGQGYEFLAGIRHKDAAAQEHDGFFSSQKHVHGFLNLL